MVPDGIANITSLYVPALFAFWVIICSAYMPELAGCHFRKILSERMFVKHCVGACMVYYTLTMVSPQFSQGSLWKNVIFSLTLYCWFLMTTRTPFDVFCVMLAIMIFISWVDQQRLAQDTSDQDKKYYTLLLRELSVLVLFITICGNLIYLLEKRQEYGADFTWYRFFVGSVHCRSIPGS